MDRSQNQALRVSTEVDRRVSWALTFDEVPRLQIGGLLNNGAVFDVRPRTRSEVANFSEQLVNGSENPDRPSESRPALIAVAEEGRGITAPVWMAQPVSKR
jgi:hypothetical protein